MLAAVFAAALVSAPLPPDDITRNVLVDVCLPFVNGDSDRAAVEFLGFTVASEDGAVVDMVSSDERQAYLLRLAGGDDAEDGEVRRTCTLQARGAALDTVKRAIRQPLEQAGFTAEPVEAANRLIWTRQGVTVSVRQNEGRATVVRVSYSSLEAGG
ncbi:hypothetical protein [Brevundimonas sp.]|uniref:hypothetical protein n=1 Tax=Brevundimonas sp. TaxID=1871086 RepID=UPI0025C25435|nr:hypothetical protein [Brevundimonas sp.]